MISRFGKQHEIAVDLSLLVPKQVVQCDDFKPLEDSTRFYAKIISDFNIDVTLKIAESRGLEMAPAVAKMQVDASHDCH